MLPVLWIPGTFNFFSHRRWLRFHPSPARSLPAGLRRDRAQDEDAGKVQVSAGTRLGRGQDQVAVAQVPARSRPGLDSGDLYTVLLTWPLLKKLSHSNFFVGLCSSLCCICKLLCRSNIWVQFSISPVHELSSREEKNSWQSWDLNPWLLGEKRKRYLCAMQPHFFLRHDLIWRFFSSHRCFSVDPAFRLLSFLLSDFLLDQRNLKLLFLRYFDSQRSCYLKIIPISMNWKI